MRTGLMLSATLRRGMSLRSNNRIIPTLKACVLVLTVMVGLAFVALSAHAQTFDAPGAGTGLLQGTISVNINTAGDVTGFYYDASNVAHGFLRMANGTISTFSAPGAGGGVNQGTFATSINTKNEVAGMYADANNVYHGFVRTAQGAITEFDVTAGGKGKHQGVQAPLSINTAGEIAGAYKDGNDLYHGFVRAAKGAITTFDVSVAGTAIYQGTKPISINTAGEIAGGYIDSTYLYHGFVRSAAGAITTFDAPGAGGTGNYKGFGNGTEPIGINTSGEVAGDYTDASGVRHGFMRTANGATTNEFDAPGADTAGISINTAGTVVGIYGNAYTLLSGFVRTAKGVISTFSIPGSASGMLIGGTGGFSINTAGQVTGTYSDASSVFHGFVLTPSTTTLSSSQNPSTFGQTVIFTAVVASKAGEPTNGETVSFMQGSTLLGTGTLSGGTATFAISTLQVGKNSITAVYSNDSSLLGSTSKVVKQVVKAAK